ncbi:MAG: hypothetical protein COV52_00460 [Gammaproteobacteria bacterium CG11_big_fil_rev_8_21_14_0_20_46_22]|nr:MAG: hypothetical protein COW05_09055 [Gammaproteobacteria bacterium CG12_big_fil_rev_8_21_14_0_65_46_12]PIR12128.1 MAG: hypothetical protein COV52_00460 [Gammaproteobacteria bacterium CG11_big_fil_rev_8_21_14_0_20_46_22]
MKVLLNSDWRDGYLSSFHLQKHIVVKPRLIILIDAVEQQYVQRSSSLTALKNYIGKIGIRATFTKVISRWAERHRNKKYILCGIGEVLRDANGNVFKDKQYVLFVLPNHSKCTDVVVVHESLVFPVNSGGFSMLSPEKLYFFEKHYFDDIADFEKLKGWSFFSGIKIESLFSREKVSERVNFCANEALSHLSEALVLPVNPSPETRFETSSLLTLKKSRINAVLYGYGNYAKTCVIPNISRCIHLAAVHEIDPLQIGKINKNKFSVSTSPFFNDKQPYDIYFIAGFHHMHAELAIRAIRIGAVAVIEKPVATTTFQLKLLKEALLSMPKAKAFVCFQKRYSPFNQFILKDLSVSSGDPVHFHCIVFEEKLPSNHWYLWPNSCSRLVSNGCHWIDYFLFLNGFSHVRDSAVRRFDNGALLVNLSLVNGAIFSMVLTDDGSHRIGVQDYIELRSACATVKINNNQDYFSENNSRVIRKVRVNKMVSFERMYREISRKACKKCELGDSVDALTYTAEVVLDLERHLDGLHA